jgi:hypothetical protein
MDLQRLLIDKGKGGEANNKIEGSLNCKDFTNWMGEFIH